MHTSPLPCLYCASTLRTDDSVEHVLQNGFGSRWTLPNDEVCGECNTKVFSPLDTCLVHFVRTYVCWDHPDVSRTRTILQEGHSLSLDAESGHWLSVRIDKNIRPVTFPQLIFLGSNWFQLVVDRKADPNPSAMVQSFQAELRQPQLLSLETLIVARQLSDGEPQVQPALIRSAPLRYLIRAPDQATAAAVEAAVQSGRLLAEWTRQGEMAASTTNPRVRGELQIDFGSMERALAKSALNLVCATLGSTVARQREFDGVRQFTLSTYDSKSAGFVSWVFGTEAGRAFPQYAACFARPGEHVLLLADVKGVPLVTFNLYQRELAVVRLAAETTRTILPPNTGILCLFDYKRGTHRVVSMGDDPVAFARLLFDGQG